jgi:cholesterol transport system auxiliary component
MIRARHTLSFAIAGLALTACVSFGGKPPKTLLTLTPDATLAAGTTRTGAEGQTIVILSPGAPAILLNNRVAVRSNGNDVAYLKDAAWADTPPHLFASLLAETISAKTKLVVIDRRQYATAPGARLSGQLVDFNWDASARKAVVRYDAALMPGDGKPLLTRRFEASAPAASDDPETVVRALNTAANQVASEVAEWVAQ